MTEARIFELLLTNSKSSIKNDDFPQLHPELVDAASKTLTNSIYNSFKVKSTSSSHKRLETLKFVQSLVCRNQRHDSITLDNYPEYLKTISSTYTPSEEHDKDFRDILKQIDKELKEIGPKTLCDSILDYNKRKAAKTKRKLEEIERIRKIDLETLNNNGFHPNFSNIYETFHRNEDLIQEIFLNNSPEPINTADINDQSPNCYKSSSFRKKQIKYAHALVNFEKWQDLKLILDRLKTYTSLDNFELDFLVSLSTNNKLVPSLQLSIAEDFPFIYEKLVIKTCTPLLKLQDDLQVSNYLEELLLESPEITVLMEICRKNSSLHKRIKNLCFVLYTYSYCNSNVAKFCDFLLN